MKRNLVNFTRGSQLLGHFSFMFAAGLKGPLIVACAVIGWTSWWTLSGSLIVCSYPRRSPSSCLLGRHPARNRSILRRERSLAASS